MDERGIEELRARLVMQETLIVALLTHAAALAPNPAAFIRAVMANAEDNLARVREAATDETEQRMAGLAEAAFDNLGDAIARHLSRIEGPAGRG